MYRNINSETISLFKMVEDIGIVNIKYNQDYEY